MNKKSQTHRLVIVLDFDGVLVDTPPALRVVLERFLNIYGGGYSDELFESLNGKTITEIIAQLKKTFNLKPGFEYLKSQYLDLMNEVYDEISLMDGALNFLEFCKASQVPVCIASGAQRKQVDRVIDRFNLRDFFYTTITADDVLFGKPKPDLFLKIKSQFDAESKFLVFDDAINGLLGAESAGMHPYFFGQDCERKSVESFSQISQLVLKEILPSFKFVSIKKVDVKITSNLNFVGHEYEEFCRVLVSQNPTFFDGPYLLLESIIFDEGHLYCHVVATTYFNYLFASKSWQIVKGINPIAVGVSGLICDAKNRVLIGKRTEATLNFPGAIELVGSGNLIPNTLPSEHALQELIEETGITPTKIDNQILLGFYFDAETSNFDLCYYFNSQNILSLDGSNEYEYLYFIDPRVLHEKEGSNLVPTSLGILEHFLDNEFLHAASE